MANFEITNPIYLVNKASSVDSLYGTYPTLAAAETALTPLALPGRLFAVQETGQPVKLYVWQGAGVAPTPAGRTDFIPLTGNTTDSTIEGTFHVGPNGTVTKSDDSLSEYFNIENNKSLLKYNLHKRVSLTDYTASLYISTQSGANLSFISYDDSTGLSKEAFVCAASDKLELGYLDTDSDGLLGYTMNFKTNDVTVTNYNDGTPYIANIPAGVMTKKAVEDSFVPLTGTVAGKPFVGNLELKKTAESPDSVNIIYAGDKPVYALGGSTATASGSYSFYDKAGIRDSTYFIDTATGKKSESALNTNVFNAYLVHDHKDNLTTARNLLRVNKSGVEINCSPFDGNIASYTGDKFGLYSNQDLSTDTSDNSYVQKFWVTNLVQNSVDNANYIPLEGTIENKPASGTIKTTGVWSVEGEGATSGVSVLESGLERFAVEDAQQALGEAGSLREYFYPLEYRLIHETGTVFNSIVSDYDGFYINSSDPSSASEGNGAIYTSSVQAGIRYVSKDNKDVYNLYSIEATATGLEARKGAGAFIASNDADVVTKYNLQNFNYPTNWGSATQRMTALPDKSTDATYNLFMGMDGNGNIAKFDNAYNMLYKSFSTMTSAQALTLGQLLNGGQGSAGAMSVNLISPPVLMNIVSENTYVVLRGANLLLNSTAMGIEIIDASSNIVATVPNNQIQLNTNGLELVFYYDFSTLPIGTYRLRIYSGVKVYVTTLELKIVSSVENIDINNMTWDIVRDSTLDVSKASIEYSGGTLVSYNTTANGSDSSNIAFTVKSSKMFNIGEDFLIELSVDFNYGQQNTGNTFQTRFGVGYDSDLVNTYKQLSYISFQRRNNAAVGVSFNGSSLVSKPLPFTDNLTFIKQGNLLTTISETGVVRTMTISNNSDYCLWLSSIYRASNETINIDVLKAFKFNDGSTQAKT